MSLELETFDLLIEMVGTQQTNRFKDHTAEYIMHLSMSCGKMNYKCSD